MGQHAILSPSGASRWLACTPSARLEQAFPDKAGAAAAEGTLAHSLGEVLIKQKLKLLKKNDAKGYMNSIENECKDKGFDFAPMLEHAENYAVFVLEQYAEAQAHTKDALIFLEQKLNLTDWVPEGFGTGDVVIIADNTLTIIDLKYGKGVKVTAWQNKQMMLYSLGALREFSFLYDIDKIRMTIYQPRLDSISSFEILVSDLQQWAADELIPKAKLAFDGEGEFVPGLHCQFCKAGAVCKVRAEYNLELAKHEFANPALLNDNEVSDILKRAKMFTDWLGTVEDYALAEAVNNGKHWPEFKLVEGRSIRKYLDEITVAAKVVESGYSDEQIYKKSLLGIGDMEKLIGKKVFADVLGPFIIKPPGKPTLVHESDKRPAINSSEAAKVEFAGVEIDE
ncbi:MAG: DUF2800 domain-containing protein [Acinetobacter sp.]|uniref:DUF2800 domain-containing protein n=1 Tax=Acinetobacter sp. TaxID=472 RepID=UPI000FC19E5E|nr:DUF2800 domain-containing protein [Acinetobacter sp.]RUP39783.1 MAG: DUF2800 domain-containing protein [Acinetobacter sp.]